MKHSKNGSANAPARATVRCAIYTRKSTDEGLEKEFNSLDAQRESGEACVKSQQHEGWICLSDRYDDGGFTGGNLDRPAWLRLRTDIEAGKIDVVVVYKIDRLSRRLLDFSQIMEIFEKHNVAFVSVTQQFNTATSMGRLMMNVLLSFAQFEREIIGERTRDKIAAARRRGKWVGGMPILGFDVDANGSKLRVNEAEAARVREIFDLYIDLQSLLPVVTELNRRGCTTKRWQTRKGHMRGGNQFTRTNLHRLLTNVAYAGKIRYKHETHPGEHKAIVTADQWRKVQGILQRNNISGGALVRNKFGSLLKGLIHCTPCRCAMTPSHTSRGGGKRYRYYVCSKATQQGWDTCPSKSIPAGEMEDFVVDQIRAIGQDQTLITQTLEQVGRQCSEKLAALETELRGVERDVRYWNEEIRNVAPTIAPGETATPAVARLADLNERIRLGESRMLEIQSEKVSLRAQEVSEDEIQAALAEFDPVWQALPSREQAWLIHQLIESVDYDGAKGKASIRFHETGIPTLAQVVAQHREEMGE